MEITTHDDIDNSVDPHIKDYLLDNPLSSIIDQENEPIEIKRFSLNRELYIEFDTRFIDELTQNNEHDAIPDQVVKIREKTRLYC